MEGRCGGIAGLKVCIDLGFCSTNYSNRLNNPITRSYAYENQTICVLEEGNSVGNNF